MRKAARLLPLLPALWLAACSGSGSDSAAAPQGGSPDPVGGFRIKSGDSWTGDHDGEKIKEKFGSHSPYMTDDKGRPMGEKKDYAAFNRDNPEFNGRWEGKSYKAGDYRKKSWWGDRDYVKKVYGGNTDGNALKKDSRFGGQAAGEGTMTASDAGKNYRTGQYAATASREDAASRLSKTRDAETDERRRVFTDPDIIPYQQQNGMTMDDVKSALGR